MSASAGDATTAFSPRAFTFLRGIAKNNRKEWFEAHRTDFEREIKQPLAQLVEEVDVHLATFAPEIVGSPKKSVFRIHRDVRFSNAKSPYKTHAACWFFHRDAGRGVGTEAAHGGAGFYFHIEQGKSFCGGGIWMPPRSAVHKIRQALTDDLDGFEAIVKGRAFRRRFGDLDTDGMLTRLPRGFAADQDAQFAALVPKGSSGGSVVALSVIHGVRRAGAGRGDECHAAEDTGHALQGDDAVCAVAEWGVGARGGVSPLGCSLPTALLPTALLPTA